MRIRPIRFVACGAVVLLLAAAIPAATSADQPATQLDELHRRLERTRAEISTIQDRAESVEAQIASIDEQAAAIQKALEALRILIVRRQSEIASLEREIAEISQLRERVQQRLERVAVSLYKNGPAGGMEVLLGSESFAELEQGIEFAAAAAENRQEMLVQYARLTTELNAEQEQLDKMLQESLAFRNEKRRQAQHLKELRAAKGQTLAELRREIQSTRREAAAIATRSQEIEDRLARAQAEEPVAEAEAPAAPTAPASAPEPPSTSRVGGFAWPVAGAVTSGYGERWGRMHQGIDIDCVTGDLIRASKSGVVIVATYDGGYGYHVVIDHGGGFASLYAHNSKLYVSSGSSVAQGEGIAACGSTGQSTGDHLHFEIRVNGAPHDPMKYLP
jgi:murein DD-endopeptidase MepM/ murein hydrolase activator NlpD